MRAFYFIIFIESQQMCRIILKQCLDLFPPTLEKSKESGLSSTFSPGKLSFRSNSSQRSKYISSSKLTRTKLFSVIEGKKTAQRDEKHQEANTQLSVLHDLVSMGQEKESEVTLKFRNQMKSYKNDCRKLLRALEHYQL